MPPSVRGSEATLVVNHESGAIRLIGFKLNGKGDGTQKAPFGRRKVAEVTLVLTNASDRFSCWENDDYPWYSCYGTPLDDRLHSRLEVQLT
jgi:hypothetical protein